MDLDIISIGFTQKPQYMLGKGDTPGSTLLSQIRLSTAISSNSSNWVIMHALDNNI